MALKPGGPPLPGNGSGDRHMPGGRRPLGPANGGVTEDWGKVILRIKEDLKGSYRSPVKWRRPQGATGPVTAPGLAQTLVDRRWRHGNGSSGPTGPRPRGTAGRCQGHLLLPLLLALGLLLSLLSLLLSLSPSLPLPLAILREVAMEES